MPLTDLECKNAACPPELKRVRLADGQGLYLEVAPAGSKRWFWKYYFGGKEKRLALGSYPDTAPKAARLKRDEARLLQQAGSDPAQERIVAKLQRKAASVNTFEAVARDFHQLKASGWSDHYAERWLARLEKDVLPWIGKLPIVDVKAPLLLSTLRRVEGRGVKELAHSLREACGQVFKHGNSIGACEHNPAATLGGALKPVATKHMAAVLEPKAAGDLMRAIYGYEGQPSTRTALELSALIFQRPGNVRAMEWAWVDLDSAMLTIPADSMKRIKAGKINGRPHFVPLAPRAVELLKDLQPLTGHGRFVFPSLLTGERAMSDNTLRTALRRMGFDNDTMTPHGFRAMARTLMVERLNVHPDVIEAQLAHGKSGPLGMAYDRAEFMEQRRQMMDLWADYLQRLAQGAEIVPFKAA
ncbi:tyrosine-type recombinase/integrase [Roseateles sp. LYH14W]|uniref:Tyrosine-type recombinase/integrase n=1 Tax=Pelomonas parva TaxID=3299032 RepID=A0ABW7EVQ8_9BURK